MNATYYKQTINFGAFRMEGSGEQMTGLAKLVATGTVQRSGEANTNLVSSVEIDDDRVKVIRNGDPRDSN